MNKKCAYILTCVDPANIDELVRIFNVRFGKGNFFIPTELGGVKNLISPGKESDREHLVRKIRECSQVHPISIFVLVNHSECGKYRLSGYTFDDRVQEQEFHTQEMTKAQEFLKKEFPDIPVEINYFLKTEQKIAW
ncbi:MAG: hypothetical protein A3C07_04515 [Candidatus Sungbacteria bacterium RIFCSPHIGHO2_02_FULL_47_11]|uniref:Carbonic anhydrase n=1 Tax=Candidatus Sungbacteria bacterium RIFCSPHIGHO2_02_FULL_47_11 TaxID=1802270 RepID=A0A1G2KLC1_9BACT|nr:MAG: hypothetical protein A3C07_04515 [Candidatus Sungbacteria bacterium RIFCSPHIGHO2_02_FULL_47_11]